MKKRDEVKLAVMDALRFGPRTLFDLVLQVDLPDVPAVGYLGTVLGELVRDGYLIETDEPSSVSKVYKHTHLYSLSDLRASLLPLRDPVREGHEFEQTRGSAIRYRRPTQGSADLDIES